MKMNCQIMDSAEIAKMVASHIANEGGKGITYKGDSCYLTKNGDFHFVYMDDNGVFSAQRTFTANDIAYIANMPLWEIIGVDKGGFDETAILLYEEN